MQRMLQRLIGEDIQVGDQLAKDLSQVHADPGQLEQVLMNLVVNARDAMPQGGELRIETANVQLDGGYAACHSQVKPGSYVMLAISDSGCGMDAATQDRIFEPFYTTKELGKGTGLGLATVYGIVKQSGGYIWVYSEAGLGTTFKIYLPVLESPVRVGSEPIVGSSEVASGYETVLLVEDEEGLRGMVGSVLKSHGYKVLEARHPMEALQLSEDYKDEIHLLLTDVVMPQCNGSRLAELLQPERPEMKVIYMSGYTNDAIVRNGVLNDEVHFLQKPFSPGALVKKIRESLQSLAQTCG
jgi:CheY-like chemotaxis protein